MHACYIAIHSNPRPTCSYHGLTNPFKSQRACQNGPREVSIKLSMFGPSIFLTGLQTRVNPTVAIMKSRVMAWIWFLNGGTPNLMGQVCRHINQRWGPRPSRGDWTQCVKTQHVDAQSICFGCGRSHGRHRTMSLSQ